MTEREIENLFKTHYTRMYRLAASILYDEDESKDVVSEVFSRLIASNVTLRLDTADAYLLMGVRNQCRNVMKQKQVRERFLHLLSEEATFRLSPLTIDFLELPRFFGAVFVTLHRQT